MTEDTLRDTVGRTYGCAHHATQPTSFAAASTKICISIACIQSPRPPTIALSFRRYSPVSAWWNATMPDGSSLRQSSVLFAVVAKPSGMSDIEHTTTPAYAGVLSVIRPSPLFRTWLPYKNDISADGFSHTCANAS